MGVVEAFGRDDRPAHTVATDIDVDALAVAARGEYAEVALRTLEPALRERFMIECGDTGRFSIPVTVRQFVEFHALNLAAVRQHVGEHARSDDMTVLTVRRSR